MEEKEKKVSSWRLPMYLCLWSGVLFLAVAIFCIFYYNVLACLIAAVACFFGFAVSAALFTYFAIKYSRDISPAINKEHQAH